MQRLAVLALLALALLAPTAAAALEPYETALVSRQSASAGGAPHVGGDILDVELSGDGRFVAFRTDSQNLGPDPAAQFDRSVYLRDIEAETTTVVAEDAAGLSMSRDGRFVAYVDIADGAYHVMVRDLRSGVVSLVSRASGADGAPADGQSADPVVSDDGRYVLFHSLATNLGAGPRGRVYVRDTLKAKTIALGPLDRVGTDVRDATLSGNGRYATIEETEQYDSCCAEAYRFRVHLVDVRSGKRRTIDKLNRNGLDRHDEVNPTFTASGRFVIFSEAAGPLVVYDTKTRRRRPVDRRRRVGQPPQISANGRWLPFSWRAGRSLDSPYHAWLFDRRRGRRHLASRQSGRSGKVMRGFAAGVSDDGRIVAFLSGDQVYARRVLP